MVTTKLFSVFEDIVEINEQILERKVIISKWIFVFWKPFWIK
jgi:hypothetical protein